MSNHHTYKKLEIVGTSPNSIEEAITALESGEGTVVQAQSPKLNHADPDAPGWFHTLGFPEPVDDQNLHHGQRSTANGLAVGAHDSTASSVVTAHHRYLVLTVTFSHDDVELRSRR